jgi:hypothetical protein
MTPEVFRAWAQRLGLGRLDDDDLRQLQRGWEGLQPQLARVRAGLPEDQRPPAPPLGMKP